MQSLVFFIIALAVLIAVHEFGHFWVARRCGVKVLKFSIGFGKPLWQKTDRTGTQFVVAAIPLGGFVKMLDEREGPVESDALPYAFNRKPLASRVAIVAAGPLANLIFAVLAYWIILLAGVSGIKTIIDGVEIDTPAYEAQLQAGDMIQAINGEPTPTWQSAGNVLRQIAEEGGEAILTVQSAAQTYSRTLMIPQQSILTDKPKNILELLGLKPVRYQLTPVIGKVLPNSPAEIAGFELGDTVVFSDQQKITTWSQWVEQIEASPERTLDVIVERQGQQHTLKVTPEKREDGKGRLGIAVYAGATPTPKQLQAELSYGPIAGLVKALNTTWQMSALTVKSIFAMIQGEISSKNIGGPISIAQFAGSSADKGIQSFLSFLAIISISLGILNLLPIPILDGGHLMLYAIEWIKGSPVSEQAQIQVQKVGLILLLALMVFAFFNDLSRLFGL